MNPLAQVISSGRCFICFDGKSTGILVSFRAKSPKSGTGIWADSGSRTGSSHFLDSGPASC